MNKSANPSPEMGKAPGLGKAAMGLGESFAKSGTAPLAGGGRSTWNNPQAKPTPLPKRPKGRFFVGGLVLAVILYCAFVVWTTFFRYQAYGVLQGRVIDVAAPCDGIVAELHVREGQFVHKGDSLISLESLPLKQQLARNHDELRVAQASLSAEIARLKLEADLQNDRAQKALAEYYEIFATFRRETASLEEYAAELNRAENVRRENRGGMSDAEFDRRKYTHAGQLAKVESLRDAVEKMRQRTEIYREQTSARMAQLEPIAARVESLQAESGRLREQLARTRVCAPVNGIIVKQHLFTGEYAKTSDALLQILEDGSLEAVVYVPQKGADVLAVGEDVKLVIAPGSRTLTGRVARICDQYEPPPPNIERYYRSKEKLLVVHVQPDREVRETLWLRLGAEVCLPYRWMHRLWAPSATPGGANSGAAQNASTPAATAPPRY
jgi:multidrug resistance efflux pump